MADDSSSLFSVILIRKAGKKNESRERASDTYRKCKPNHRLKMERHR